MKALYGIIYRINKGGDIPRLLIRKHEIVQ